MKITTDDLTGSDVAALLDEHLQDMIRSSPPGAVYALDVEGLRAPDVTFWTARDGDELLGCGALKEIDAEHGEIKSMRTADAHLGKGVASGMLRHLIDEARRRNYKRLSLETGSWPPFEPAHALYKKFGFDFCGPFADYEDEDFSVYMTLEL